MTASTDIAKQIGSLEDLYRALPDRHYEPLWTMKGALTPEPVTSMLPWLWPYDEVRALVARAGDLISAEDADRRVLAMRNPGTAEHELTRATDTLWAAIQLILPGEVAPPHRHTPAALRFIVEGRDAYTVVDGCRVDMEPGDLLITPSWSWHEHGHAGADPMIWLDGLDLPMLHTLRLVFAEFVAEGPTDSVSAAPATIRSGELRPLWAPAHEARTLVWKLRDAEQVFEALRDDDGDPHDDLVLEYRDPATDGPVMPTMAAFLQLLRPGVETEPHRHTASVVYHVVRGQGSSVVAGRRLEWRQGDTFAIPTWAEHSHANPGSDDALLFSFSDEPAVRALGVLRKQP